MNARPTNPTSPTNAAGPRTYAAVDLGASNGRVITGRIGPETLDVSTSYRFPIEPDRRPDGLHWDIRTILQHVYAGLRVAATAQPRTIGVDSWAVDFGFIDRAGELVDDPFHYRDGRTAGQYDELIARIPAEEIYRITGIQFMPINTSHQLLAASRHPGGIPDDATLLLIPDLIAYWLTGVIGAERTNASTTQLYDVRHQKWATAIIERLGLPPHIFPPPRDPGTKLGQLRPNARKATDLPPEVEVVTVASHDTASAVAAIPTTGDRFAYVSAGTWSLVGVELSAPILTTASRRENFTNEVGVDGTIRYLRNVMGLWLLQECQRRWHELGQPVSTKEALAAAANARPFAAVVNPDEPEFLAPADMPARIDAYCRRTNQQSPTDVGGYVRCVLESLALAHRKTIRTAAELSGRDVDVIHIVGGGARNELLCQFTANACQTPVIAGPSEATAIGNLLIQARADEMLDDLNSARRLVAETQELRYYEPDPATAAAWSAAANRVGTR